jgi:flagellar basal body-associated protein FliL
VTDSHIILIILCAPIVAIAIALLIIGMLFNSDQAIFRDELDEEF